MNGKGLKTFVAMGLVGSVATVASADPAVVTITGATLVQNFVKSPASTRDFIDVNHDGVTLDTGLGIRQQLAPDISTPVAGPLPAGAVWLVHYRAVGSLNGLKELLRNGRTFFTGNANDPLGFPLAAVGSSDGAYFNRTQFTAGGIGAGPGSSSLNMDNPGGFPWRETIVTAGAAPSPVFPGTGANGLRADMAVLDVSGKWAATVTGTPSVNRKPGQNGYGNNQTATRRKDGTTTAFGDATQAAGAYWSRLADLGTAALYNPANASDGNTLFDTALGYEPFAPITNVGTGLQQVKMSELQHLQVTGRMPSGENFMVITRDSGSGTRNGYCNSLRIDPSYGSGDNIGTESNAADEQKPGSLYTPSNKGGSGTLETCVINTRLGIGYTGAERTPALMGVNNKAELLGVMNDVLGGTVYVRPTAANVISNNTVNTWRLASTAHFMTFGDPLAEAVSDGGDAVAHPRIASPMASAYINNIRKSIISFTNTPNDPTLNSFSPGEIAATLFVLPAGVEWVADTADLDSDGDVTEWIANPTLNTNLRDWELTHSTYFTNNTLLASFGAGNNGLVPTRRVLAGGSSYSDGVDTGGNYKNQAGVNVSFGSAVTARNKLCGDFNNDGVRNLNDIPGMIAAWRDRQGLGSWDGADVNGGASDTSAVIEILGDFNNDGGFNAEDVRYFADGLAMTTTGTAHLDRKAGFTAVDNASLAQGGALNFFGITAKSTGHAYTAGDSRADVAGPRVTADTLGNAVPAYFKVTPGFAPTGKDGTIDGNDITYIFKQFKNKANVPSEIVHWNNLSESQNADLSCDMNGDMQIDIQDVQEVVINILATTMGDVNLDGVQDQADADIITAHMGMTNAAWQDGDLDGDGVVSAQDLSIYLGRTKCGKADIGQQGGIAGFDGQLDNNDFIYFITAFFNQLPIADQGQQGGLPGSDGLFDNNDFIAFIANFFGGCH